LVVLVFFAAAFFLAAIFVSSCVRFTINGCCGGMHDLYGHVRQMSKKKNLTGVRCWVRGRVLGIEQHLFCRGFA
jgi:hypothetical protein